LVVGRAGAGQGIGGRGAQAGSVAVAALAQLALAAISSPAFAAVALAISGICAVVWNVITVAPRQRLAPDMLFGRGNSAYRFVAIGAIALGGAFGSTELRLPFLVAP
jgi:hypothetical protein